MNGILVVNKEKGITSFGVVREIRQLLGVKKVGHAGTLDPLAKGVLLILLGPATRWSNYLMAAEKKYRAEITFGIKTDTYDAAGKVLEEKSVFLRREQLALILPEFTGKIRQVPPMVSALHYRGKRLYDLARQGITVERTPREVFIREIKIIEFREGEPPVATIEVTCSKGTYIRTLCYDIGERLGCGAYQSDLTRIRSGRFTLEQARTLDEIKKLAAEKKLVVFNLIS